MINHDPHHTRRWVLASALPVVVALGLFYLAAVTDDDTASLELFAGGLTATAIASTVGPLVSWAYRTRRMSEMVEDDLADLRCTVRRLDATITQHHPSAPPAPYFGLRLVPPAEEA